MMKYIKIRFITVSYTHLDVYKRQLLCCVTMVVFLTICLCMCVCGPASLDVSLPSATREIHDVHSATI